MNDRQPVLRIPGWVKRKAQVPTGAPAPVMNREFTKTLGRLLRRPTLVPLPAAAVRLLFGEMGETALLGSTRVLPARLDASGFSSPRRAWRARCEGSWRMRAHRARRRVGAASTDP